MSFFLKGIIPIIPTIFHENGDIDHFATTFLAKYAINKGAKSIVYPGVASEDLYLTLSERVEIIKSIKTEINHNIPLISGINSTDPDKMLEIAIKSIDAGSDIIMAMATPSMNNKYDFWFNKIVDITNIKSIILQNAPSPRGSNLTTKQIIKLISSVPEIKYIKEEAIPSGTKLTDVKKNLDHHNVSIIGGGGARYIFEELERGIIGSMPAIELLDLHIKLFSEYTSGNRENALKLYKESLPLLILQLPYRMRLTKLILHSQNLIKSKTVREPLPEIDDMLQKFIIELYDHIKTKYNFII